LHSLVKTIFLFFTLFYLCHPIYNRDEKLKMKRSVLITLFLCCVVPIFASTSAIENDDLPFRYIETLNVGSASDENRSLFFDHNGLLWVGTNSGLKSFDGYDMRVIKSTLSSPGLLPNNTIWAITEDKNNNLWLGTRNGVAKIDMHTGNVSTYQNVNGISRITYTFLVSHDGTVWVGNDSGLSKYVPATDSFVNYQGEGIKVIAPDGSEGEMGWYSVKSIVEDAEGNLYVGTWNTGLFRFSPTTETFFSYPNLNETNSAYSLFIDSKQHLWVGSWGYGLYRIDNPKDANNMQMHEYNRGKGSFDTFYAIIEDPITHTIWASTREGVVITTVDGEMNNMQSYSTCNNGEQQLRFCNNLTTDKRGNIWIGTLNDGIVHINTIASPFQTWKLTDNGYQLPVNSVCSVFSDDGIEVWLSMKPYGIAKVNLATRTVQFNRDILGFAQMPDDFMGTSITSITRHANGEIWMANNSYGIAAYSKNGTLRHLTTENTSFLGDNYINTLYPSCNGTMWIGTGSGISVALPNGDGMRLQLNENNVDFSRCDVRGLTEDDKGNIWAATEDNGIIRISYDADNNKVLACHRYCMANGNYAVNDATMCFADSEHRLWAISNSGGLFLLDEEKDCFRAVNEKYSIPGDRIFTINEDALGKIWLTIDNALISINPKENRKCIKYCADDGLTDMLFFPNSSCRYSNTLFFACQTGFFYFKTSEIDSNDIQHIKHNLIVTDLILNETHYSQLDSVMRNQISTQTPTYTHNVTIPPSIDKFTFVFALLSYSNLSQNIYSYYLENYDNNWKIVPNGYNSATFENLPSGHYKLHLRATDAYGNIAEISEPIAIVILPPWYASNIAIIIYAILVVVIVMGYIKWYQNHLLTLSRLQMAVVLTNITHELLTPMAVISAAVDELRKKMPEHIQTYSLIQNNITRLTRLLRQVLEVRKSQAGQLRLLVSNGNLSDFVSNTCNNISPIINLNDCSLKLDIESNINAWFDPDKVDKILYNLLSNAQKYNRNGGKVTVSLCLTSDQKEVVLTIADEGIGISPEQMKKLYSRFFDGNYRRTQQGGTGIGLSLTRELVVLHHGTIDCKSQLDVGTTFTITLPITKDDYSAAEIDETRNATVIDKQLVAQLTTNDEPKISNINTDSYRILIVEDNEELLSIMQRLLSTRYYVFSARNGKQALNIIYHEELDLVISDVMMPIMDGNELTRTIKNDPNYCQLPIILLTAKVNSEDRNEGLIAGADDYLTKPFNLADLNLRIDNIITNRERVRKRFLNVSNNDVIAEEHISNPDEIFLQKAIDCIERNISNSNYDRDSFASDMCVSSSTLYNKLRALTGNSITSFITSVRLKKAIIIARSNPQISIADLSEQVGFATPKYFSKCFKKEYGMLLKEYLATDNES